MLMIRTVYLKASRCGLDSNLRNIKTPNMVYVCITSEYLGDEKRCSIIA